MRGRVAFDGFEPNPRVRAVAEWFIFRSAAAAEIDRTVLIGFARLGNRVTAWPFQIDCPNNHMRAVRSRHDANVCHC